MTLDKAERAFATVHGLLDAPVQELRRRMVQASPAEMRVVHAFLAHEQDRAERADSSKAEFARLEKQDEGWDAFDWSKKSLAVVASSGQRYAVLWSVGPHVQFEMTEHGLDFDDLGLEPPDAGIWIWEGKTAGGERDYWGDYNDTYLNGDFREPTAREWSSIIRGECPWDEAAWMKSREPDLADIEDRWEGLGDYQARCKQCGLIAFVGADAFIEEHEKSCPGDAR